MGTEITLEAGRVTLDYAKNNMGADYGYLYQSGDEVRRVSDQINYEYYEKNPEDAADIAVSEMSFVRPLSRVLPRLAILGFTLNQAREEYEALCRETVDLHDDDEEPPEPMTFEDYCGLVCRYRLLDLSDEYIESGSPDHDELAQGRLAGEAAEFKRLPSNGDSDLYYSEASYFSSKLCILSAPSMLQIFGLNPENANTEIIWQFGPLVSAGWVNRESFHPGARREDSLLVVTEGKSDVQILKRALAIFRPDVADFFRFIDVTEPHHFWGAGKVVNFAEGLLRIDVQNKILILLDNDAEGVGAYQKLKKLAFPPNMIPMLLPELEDFRDFPARGPEGIKSSDINGRAAAIECYLDLELKGEAPAQVIWSNYKPDTDSWQGALAGKERYTDHFRKQTDESLRGGGYDCSKLMAVLDALISNASRMSSPARAFPSESGITLEAPHFPSLNSRYI